MRPSFFKHFALAGIIAIVAMSCQKSADNATTTTSSATLPDVFKKFNTTVTISVEGNYVVLKSNAVPDHKSPYFATTDSRYEAYNGSNAAYAKNPNSIITQNLTFKIPLNPASAATKQATALGPIGISLNGVPFYNQYAGPNQPLTNEINSFDQYNGHPQQSGQYHYHVEPLFLTSAKGRGALLGFLLDGYPVYGPLENGTLVLNSSLDAYHGHTHVTTEYPNGIYHYHITADAPYINGNGYYGTPGTVTQ
ncbi:MAG TPA: YHYH protein [Chitinophagaceae bacterium]|nr:YHYH protein [Chitinophagaceae bacterium]HCT22386.1 YHYH protein [Chitinophagaceae bacterium]